ncbi:hypothetical protein DPMN_178970 [Dreissena polymorpha]|uniref:Uncharacterized protein n=2 Tax=Dreissena polymorpha TaxID=45954 RepID=A0A9D4EDW6_DREPO|nr:hypothetical protein DPMN_178970 [Dreissena polymorpha]
MAVIRFVIKPGKGVDSSYNTHRKIENFMKGTSSDDEIVISPILPEKERNKRAAEDTFFNILFLSRAKYDLNYKGNPDVNVTAVVVKIINAIEKGDIYFGSEIRSVSQCEDFHCANTSWTVIPPISPINGEAEKHISIPILISSGVIWLIWSTV